MKLWHGVPKKMRGDRLIPLNDQKEIYPDLYEERYALQYKSTDPVKDREWLPRRRIPLLGNCLWNDVVHTTPVHPEILLRELTVLGRPFKLEYFEIETRDLDQSRFTIYLYSERPDQHAAAFPESEFVPFSEEAGQRYSVFTDAQRQKWKDVLAYRMANGMGKLGLARYEFIPHVLYRGNIPIANCPRITVG